METKNLADLYKLPPMHWAAVEARLAQGITMAPDTGGPNRHACWLATINADGSAHVNGIGAMWIDGTWWFVTGERSRKGRNLARDPRCSISIGVHEFDLVVEGKAEKVTDPATVATIAGVLNAGGRLYHDVADRKPPVVPYLYAGIFRVVEGEHGAGFGVA